MCVGGPGKECLAALHVQTRMGAGGGTGRQWRSAAKGIPKTSNIQVKQ
jgi:hypothetical protein